MKTNLFSLRVSGAMSRDVVTVRGDASLHEALELMVANRVSALPVVDKNGHCVGMLSTSDLIDITLELDEQLCHVDEEEFSLQAWLLRNLEHRMGAETVSSLMSERVEDVRAESLLVEAARRMTQYNVHRLPVTNNSHRVTGIISTTDILRAFVEAVPVT